MTAARAHYRPHHLWRSELAALGAGTESHETIRRLSAGWLSRHQLLLEYLRRGTPSGTDAFELLRAVQQEHGAVVADVLGLPQVGGWLTRQVIGGPEEASGFGGYLAALAATAALRARHPAGLTVPAAGDRVLLPGLGTIRLPEPAGSARLRVRRTGATIAVGGRTYVIGARAPLILVPRLRLAAKGHVARFRLDDTDAQLDRYHAPLAGLDAVGRARWSRRLAAAWRLLATEHPAMAATFAIAVRTVVPLRSAGRPFQGTSGWLPGAVALSLPPDAVTAAEVLVHETHHVVLGAVDDIVPLTRPDAGREEYAPWRDDPRPPSALLQGCYAHAGVARFWRRQRHLGDACGRFHGDVEFARWRVGTLDAIERLLQSGVLTEAGAVFAGALRGRLRGWLDEPVQETAVRRAAGLLAEHRARFSRS